MSIGLSRNAQLLLAQLVQVCLRGEREGLSGDQLSFTLSVRPDRTTLEFAAGSPPLQTSDANAILVLRANGLIEEFTTIERTSNVRQYVVTQAGINAAGRSGLLAEQAALDPRRGDAGPPRGSNGRDASNTRVEELLVNTRET